MQGLGLELPVGAPLSVIALIVSLGIGAALSLLLRWHFERFGSTLSNRSEFAQVFPLIVLTTVLIITVVKSSLALSLGLVGALSIVRFRTPIKEPEELAYLFIAIAIGLGLGADQHVATVAAALIILTIVAILRWGRRGSEQTGLYLSIEWRDASSNPLEGLSELVSGHAVAADLRRVDARDGGYEVTYFVDVQGSDVVASLIDALQERFPGVGVTFVDQNQLPSV